MQSYKIYINDKPLILSSTSQVKDFVYDRETTLIARYAGNPKYLLNYIDNLEKGGKYDRILIYHQDLKKLKNDLKSLMKVIKAGGGLVENEFGEVMFIFRRGYWDLPKGKCDAKESRRKAALREVIEETGVQQISQHHLIAKTRHMYREKGTRCLKITKWYHMTAPRQSLVPQAKEQIEEAVWIKPDTFLEKYTPCYRSVQDVVKRHLEGFKKEVMIPKINP